RNASGTFRNGQVTDLWNNSQFPRVTGVGLLAFATDGQSHAVDLRRSIVQGYNVAGVLFDANAAATGSSVGGRIDQTRVQGAGMQDEQQQDGIRLEDGATATVTNADVDSNYYKPDLSRSAGIRLVDGGVAGTHITGNNIQGNGYGAMSMDAADANVAAGPGLVDAHQNWWGDTDGPCSQAASPPPAQPACPTTGEPVTGGSVDAAGWFTDPVISPQTWGDENDANPTVKITAPAEGATLQRNVAAPVTATAADDLAVQSVTFLHGSTVLGVDTAPPYETTYTPTNAEAGTSQVLIAVARDPLGHRGTDQISVRIAAPVTPVPGPEEPDEPPTVQITSPKKGAVIGNESPTTIRAAASDDNGVSSVAFVIKGHPVCVDRSAPYRCSFQPRARHVGRNGVVATATDTAGQKATDARHVVVPRFLPRRLTLGVSPDSDPTDPFTWTTRGRLVPPKGTSTRAACRSGGYVALQFQVGRTTFDTVRTKLRPDCTYRRTTEFHIAQRLLGRGRIRVLARFLGNEVLRRKTSRAKFTSAG
ncbi:MAG: large repetitive protein, partial [Actinomycetota bacterium]|nr:large repetitive protein [Actinomycetota bacterium]